MSKHYVEISAVGQGWTVWYRSAPVAWFETRQEANAYATEKNRK